MRSSAAPKFRKSGRSIRGHGQASHEGCERMDRRLDRRSSDQDCARYRQRHTQRDGHTDTRGRDGTVLTMAWRTRNGTVREAKRKGAPSSTLNIQHDGPARTGSRDSIC